MQASSNPLIRPLPGTVIAAAVLLIIKGALGLWLALVLFVATRRHHRTFLGAQISSRARGLGLVVLILAVITLVIAIELLRLVPWSRIGAFVLEGASVVLALTRIGTRPGQAIVSIAFSVAIVVLLLTGSAIASLTRASSGPAT